MHPVHSQDEYTQLSYWITLLGNPSLATNPNIVGYRQNRVQDLAVSPC